ncbi:MAG: 3-phosphoglycerate dehydrogenase [Clostridiales bacterium]|nr:3-phosphoglycerate dehydrogenase [Clostridiales bacterium]
MKNILTLNAISRVIDDVFDNTYNVSNDAESPVGIMLRSFKMHDYKLDENTIAIARAGAGVNNIPCTEYAEQGVVVFNTPGANANAVKELVLSALFIGSRNIIAATDWVKTLKGQGDEVGKLVEKGKSNFAGCEIKGKKLGVIGLGAIGALVANAALDLGMEVYGYDPFLSVGAALRLSSSVKVVKELNDIAKNCDYITIHIPYIADQNKGIINSGLIRKMKDGVVIINCARGELVDNQAIIKATESGKVAKYIVDFPADEIIGVKNIVCIPHLGASTEEAEDNCAVMAAKQLIDYIENGNIVNSVNYPTCAMPRTTAYRLVILHKNTQNILAQITGTVGNEGINISNLTNQSKGDYAVTILDIDNEVSDDAIKHIADVENIIRVRVIK